MAELVWTKDKPDKPGWYWWRGDKYDDDPEIGFVDKSLKTGTFIEGGEWEMNGLDGEWAGPISEPREG